MDFLVPGRVGAISFVECKAGHTVTPAMTVSMRRLSEAFKAHRPGGQEGGKDADLSLVYQPFKASGATHAVVPGVRALAWQEFVAEL